MGHPQCFELGEVGHPYTALPYEKTSVESFRARVRMRISGSKEDWIAANDKIKHALDAGSQDPDGARVTWSIAKKEGLVKDLQEGDSDIVLIFAHSDGNKIYMPGKSGSSISVEELRSLRRKKAPPGAVVLIACEAGVVNHDARSIAEAMLESKLATTVFAYPGL